jgi:hypothetical protein
MRSDCAGSRGGNILHGASSGWLEVLKKKDLQHVCHAEGLAHRWISDGKAKRFRASIVDLALGSYSPSKIFIFLDMALCQGQFRSAQSVIKNRKESQEQEKPRIRHPDQYYPY